MSIFLATRVRETALIVSASTGPASTISASTVPASAISASTRVSLRVRRGRCSRRRRTRFVRVVHVTVPSGHRPLGVALINAARKSSFQHSRSGRGDISFGREQSSSGQISDGLKVCLIVDHSRGDGVFDSLRIINYVSLDPDTSESSRHNRHIGLGDEISLSLLHDVRHGQSLGIMNNTCLGDCSGQGFSFSFGACNCYRVGFEIRHGVEVGDGGRHGVGYCYSIIISDRGCGCGLVSAIISISAITSIIVNDNGLITTLCTPPRCGHA